MVKFIGISSVTNLLVQNIQLEIHVRKGIDSNQII